MWSKIISWILASITALMNGFGVYTQEYVPYTTLGEYTIQEEAVDYKSLRSWYVSSYGGEGSCKVERRPGNASEPNMMQFVWLVEGGQHNPDAKLEFASGTVLLAPSKGKIINNPNSSGNKITVVNDSNDYTAYKLEILNPERWYCCADLEPTSTGLYIHSNQDHRIDLAQGDVICVAGPETTIKMWRGNSAGVLGECKTLREFMLYTTDEGGDADASISDGGTLKPSTGGQGGSTTAPSSVPGVEDADIFTKSGKWCQGDGGRWWYTAGDPNNWIDGDYPVNQYLYYQNNWYYFDDGGYMVTDWADDGHYYLPNNEYFKNVLSAHPEGSMAIKTIVPLGGYTDRFVYVGEDGLVDTETIVDSYSANGHTYVRENDYYVEAASN